MSKNYGVANCVSCGVGFEKRSSGHKYCANCAATRRKEKLRESQHDWYTRNREKLSERNRNWRAENRERDRAHKKTQRARNPEKDKEYKRNWIARNPEKAREISRRKTAKRHGLSFEQYDAFMSRTLCEICASPTRKHKRCLDHCHTSGKVRGMLCMKCNMGLGLFNDNPTKMLAAASYLKRHAA